MNVIAPAIAFALGILLGIGIAWLFFRTRTNQLVTEAISSTAAENSELTVRLEERENALNEAKQALGKQASELEHNEQQESELRSNLAAYKQAYSSRQEVLKERDDRIQGFEFQLKQYREQILTHERDLAQ